MVGEICFVKEINRRYIQVKIVCIKPIIVGGHFTRLYFLLIIPNPICSKSCQPQSIFTEIGHFVGLYFSSPKSQELGFRGVWQGAFLLPAFFRRRLGRDFSA
jgi:hypothetical protein